MQRIMFNIGWNSPGRLWGLISLVLICLSVSSCGNSKIVSSAKINEFNTVDIPPKYNGEQWQNGLLRAFNSQIIFPLDSNIQIQTELKFQFVVTKKGHLINAVILGKREKDLSEFEKEGLKVLRQCQSWTPAQNNGHAVNVLMTFVIRY